MFAIVVICCVERIWSLVFTVNYTVHKFKLEYGFESEKFVLLLFVQLKKIYMVFKQGKSLFLKFIITLVEFKPCAKPLL